MGLSTKIAGKGREHDKTEVHRTWEGGGCALLQDVTNASKRLDWLTSRGSIDTP